jgi:hydrogenase maturation protease
VSPGIRVLGLGNVLMGDDGAGPYVIQVLEAGHVLPEGVATLDLGTPGLDLVPYLAGVDVLILVDTVRSGGQPGAVRTWTRDQLLQHAPQPRLSPHDPGVKETLMTLELAGMGPRDVILVGVVPDRVGPGAGLSDAVKNAVPLMIDIVLSCLKERGHEASRRLPFVPPDIWWERPAAPVPEARARAVEPACTS